MNLIGSTVASNVVNGAGTGSAGGIWSGTGPPVALASCTVAGNNGDSSGGGVAGVINGTVADTIIAGNSASSSPDVSGAFSTAGFNLIGNTNGSTGWYSQADLLNVNPLLGPLQNNGGPMPTMLPATNSPAIDKGENAAGLLTDQRDRCRIYDNPNIPNGYASDGSDIGAVELNPPHTTTVTTNIDGFGAATLRYCIYDAQPMDTITFAPGVSGVVTLYNVFGGELLINKSLAIVGPGAKVLAVSAATTNRVFHINGGGTVSISGLTITNGVASYISASAPGAGGGAIFNLGSYSTTLIVVACTLSSNVISFGVGGGIDNYNVGGTATVEISDTILQAGVSGVNLVNNGGAVTSLGYNLSSDDADRYLLATGDQINTDPMLGPLADNGGPTPTMALLPGSPAIDKGKSFGLTTDQRGAPRPYDFAFITNASGGDGSDIGAFELASPKLNIQQTGSSAVLSWPSYYGSGEFGLQSSTNIASSNSWVTEAGTPSVIGMQYFQTNNPISGNKYFRLKSN